MNWIWLSCGVMLVLAEFVIPGFVICFFGVSAMVVAGIRWIFPALPLVWQLLIFGVLGVGLLLAFRRVMPKVFQGGKVTGQCDVDLDGVAGAAAVCREAIAPGKSGKVEFRGSLWNAEAASAVAPGERCLVQRRENLTLIVEKVEVE